MTAEDHAEDRAEGHAIDRRVADDGETSAFDWAWVRRPYPGEIACGDEAIVVELPERGLLIAVVDALGHGPEAAVVAAACARAARAHAGRAAAEILAHCHEALRGSRGAAMLAVSIVPARRGFDSAGVGNVEGWHLRRGDDGALRRAALLSKAGVVGYQLPRLGAAGGELAPGDTFVLASDGVRPELADGADAWLRAAPAETAAAILARYGRDNDDALVLVARYRGGGAP